MSSPALWSSLVGEVRLDVGLSRYLVAVALCWAALTFLAFLVGPVEAERRESGHEVGAAQGGDVSLGLHAQGG